MQALELPKKKAPRARKRMRWLLAAANRRGLPPHTAADPPAITASSNIQALQDLKVAVHRQPPEPPVLRHRHAAADLLQQAQVDIRDGDAGCKRVLQPPHHLAPGVDDQAVPVALPLGIVLASLRRGDHVGLGLYRPRPQQNFPVRPPCTAKAASHSLKTELKRKQSCRFAVAHEQAQRHLPPVATVKAEGTSRTCAPSSYVSRWYSSGKRRS